MKIEEDFVFPVYIVEKIINKIVAVFQIFISAPLCLSVVNIFIFIIYEPRLSKY